MFKVWRSLTVCLLVVGVLALGQGVVSTVHAESASTKATVQTIPGESLAKKLTDRVHSSWPWYVTRASGLVAGFSLIILMLSGIGQITGHTFKILDPLTSWASHRALGIAFSVSVLVHIFSLLFDHFIPFNLLQLLVPWVSAYKPVILFGIHLGSAYVAFGIVSFYLTLLITLTSLFWINSHPKTWKFLHLTSYIVIGLVFVHALFLGTDLAKGVFRWVWLAVNAGVLFGMLARLKRVRTI